MRSLVAIAGCLLCLSSVTQAVEIRGQYLEARTCDVYTGPCFANGEMGMAGKEALMAWKVDEGGWKGTTLEGLTVALVVKGSDTLGENAFPSRASNIRSVILVDDQATEAQQLALVDFVKESLPKLTTDIQQIERMPMSLENDHYSVCGLFKAGDVAEIRTRKLDAHDCVCTNEMVYYRPLADVRSATPAYSERQSYSGDGLNSKWWLEGSRSSFLAVFRK